MAQPVVEQLGLQPGGRGVSLAAALLLVLPYLCEYLRQCCVVALGHQFVHIVHRLPDEQSLFIRQLAGQHVDLRDPVQRVVEAVGVDLQQGAGAEHGHEVELFVGLVHAPVVGLSGSIVPQSPVEVGEPGISPLYAEQPPCLAAFYLDHGLLFPFVVVEEPPGEHLFGGEPSVTAFAAEFHREVAGQRGERADALVVVDAELSQSGGMFPGQGGWSRFGRLCREYGCQSRDDAETDAPQGPAVQQAAEGALPVDELGRHGHEQQQVAGVGDGDAPGVVSHREARARPVAVVGRLVEAVASVAGNAVHGDGLAAALLLVGEGDTTHKVEGSPGAGVVFDVEPFERDREGEGLFLPVAVEVDGGGGFAQTQMQGALSAGEPGDECSAQNNQQGQMQQPGGRTQCAVAQQIGGGQQGQDKPESHESRRLVDVTGDKRCAQFLLDDGRCGQYTQHGGQQGECSSFE